MTAGVHHPDCEIPRYYGALDFETLWRDYPPAPDYFAGNYRLDRDRLRALQEERFLTQMKRAWQVPFYRRHWSKAGLEPGDIRSLDDLARIPPFSVHDLRDCVLEEPIWADYIGIDPATDAPMPLILQTSGGTTGMPRPMLFTPRDREVQNIITGRRLYMQGVRPFDLVQVVLSLGLANGGLLAREGIWKYSGAVPVMTGTGAQTPTRRQIELMKAWKVSVLVGFPAYIRHMGNVARDEMGIDPHALNIKSLIVHLGVDNREALEALWNADVFDTYGTNECGSIAAECRYKTGMHVFEDAFLLEILDPDTLTEPAPGERGVVFLTAFYKYAAPVVRYNMNDVSAFVAGDDCLCGSTHRRISRIYGRSDNMVKLRGVNLFPEAIGALVAQDAKSNGEYVCIVEATDSGEEMTVRVEVADPSVSAAALESALEARLREALGVRLTIEAVAPGSLDAVTGLSSATKVRRLIDRRAGG